MPKLSQFWTPSHIQDFSNDDSKQQTLNTRWSTNLDGFIQQAIVGNPWNALYASNQTSYFNPLTTDVPSETSGYAQITWGAFPGRINAYFPGLSSTQQLQLADTGYFVVDKETGARSTFGTIPQDPFDPVAGEQVPYGPYGPRGFQDEYCEWSVTRDPVTNKIIRVDFTCENPEYWNTLWAVEPRRVLELYQSTLGKPQIKIEDLYLKDQEGHPVVDPSTGRPAYNPLNKWNSGTISSVTQGGAMHLTATPNTIQTEMGLASAATVLRQGSHPTADSLIACAQYGQRYRNSDPNIGFAVNGAIYNNGQGGRATLANPPGLYIQTPTFAHVYTPPAGHESDDPSQFWTIVRGVETLTDAWGNALPGNFILHAKYEVPQEKGYTVSDISINGVPIEYGSQIAQTIKMQIVAWAYQTTLPESLPCVGSPATSQAQPLQLFHQNVFTSYYATAVSTVNVPMSLVSNSTLIAPTVTQGQQDIPMVITATTLNIDTTSQLPAVTFDGDDITVRVLDSFPVSYAIPGNTYPSTNTALNIVISVASNAKAGLRSIYVTNSGQQKGTAMPALLNVVAVTPSPTKTKNG